MGPIVKTLYGTVEGTQGQDLDGNSFYKFLGIPYAKPPVGELRFRDPQPPESWIGVRDATTEGNICYQNNQLLKKLGGSEDCLYLNVFTREVPSDSYHLRPVMVYIHGGGFTEGSSSTNVYGPEFLISEDVVIVTLNYRLGFLGFLRFKDPEFNISGNMGLKDQAEALRWVKTNIQQFNGDPDNVTIFGESAGAASVHYHVLSPLSRDLFHKAILQSGAALCPWADECDHSTVQIAKIHDPNISTEKEAYEILRGLSVEKLYELQVAFLEKIKISSKRPLGLVLEPASRRSAFLTKRPIDIITSGDYNKVPLIFGYNDNEGVLFEVLAKRNGKTAELTAESFIPHNVNLKSNSSTKWSYVEKLNNSYYSGPDKEKNNTNILSDAWFLAGIIGSVKNHSQTSPYPVYLYKMSLNTKLNFVRALFDLPEATGCTHGDDIGYLFKTALTPPLVKDSAEELSVRRVVKLWTNFARFGNPTPNEKEFNVIWKPAMARQLNTLNIGEELAIEVNPDGKRMELWRQIYHQNNATVKYL